MRPPVDPDTHKWQERHVAASVAVPPREDVAGDDGEVVARDPRTPVERMQTTVAKPLDDKTLLQAADVGILPPDIAAQHAAPDAPPRKLTAAQKRAIRLTQQALSLRAQGYSIGEIAESLGAAPSTVMGWFTKHRRQVDEGEIDRLLEETAVPLAAENLVHGLAAGDKDYTLKTLEGRGYFKRHTDQGPVADPNNIPALVVRVEHGGQATTVGVGRVPANQQPQVGAAMPDVKGHIVGTADRRIAERAEQEIVDAESVEDAES
jgi:DNA-binding CsgD family transcriptional regulator